MEAAGLSQMLVHMKQIARCHIPENNYFDISVVRTLNLTS
jgi:hypothetical protein